MGQEAVQKEGQDRTGRGRELPGFEVQEDPLEGEGLRDGPGSRPDPAQGRWQTLYRDSAYGPRNELINCGAATAPSITHTAYETISKPLSCPACYAGCQYGSGSERQIHQRPRCR